MGEQEGQSLVPEPPRKNACMSKRPLPSPEATLRAESCLLPTLSEAEGRTP